MSKDIKLTPEQEELLDLYVLDALETEEKLEAKLLISENDTAKLYVDNSQKMLAQFEDNSSSSPELFESIKNEISTSTNVVHLNSKRKLVTLSFISGAVAASLIAVIVGSVLWSSNDTNSNRSAFSLTKQVNAFANQSGVKSFQLHDSSDSSGPEVMLHDGNIMVDARSISGLSDDYTYQLWAVVENATGQQVISVGVLGNNPGVFMARISGDVKAFAITKEVAGGVEKSSQDAMYVTDTA